MRRSRGGILPGCSSWNDGPTRPEAGQPMMGGPSCGNYDLDTDRQRQRVLPFPCKSEPYSGILWITNKNNQN